MDRTGWQNAWVRTATTLLAVAVMIMIFCFSMENADKSDLRSGTISQYIIRILYPDFEQREPEQQRDIYNTVQVVVRKCAHFTEYMVLGFVVRLCLESWFGHKMKKHRIPALTGFGIGAAYACTDELHQTAIDGRTGKWTDVLVDSSGVLIGVMLGTMLIRSLNRKTRLNLE